MSSSHSGRIPEADAVDVDGRVRLVVSDRGAQADCGPGQPPSAVRAHPDADRARRGPTADAAKTGARGRRRWRLRAAHGRGTVPERRDRTTRTAADSPRRRRHRRHPLGHRVRGVRTGRVRGILGRYRDHGPVAIVLTTRLTALRPFAEARGDGYDRIRRYYQQGKHLKQLTVARHKRLFRNGSYFVFTRKRLRTN